MLLFVVENVNYHFRIFATFVGVDDEVLGSHSVDILAFVVGVVCPDHAEIFAVHDFYARLHLLTCVLRYRMDNNLIQSFEAGALNDSLEC